jgi:hypothetical protein
VVVGMIESTLREGEWPEEVVQSFEEKTEEVEAYLQGQMAEFAMFGQHFDREDNDGETE